MCSRISYPVETLLKKFEEKLNGDALGANELRRDALLLPFCEPSDFVADLLQRAMR